MNDEKQIWPFLAKSFFQFLAHFRQLLWNNRLDIARSTTTVGGRLYGVGRIILGGDVRTNFLGQTDRRTDRPKS